MLMFYSCDYREKMVQIQKKNQNNFKHRAKCEALVPFF